MRSYLVTAVFSTVICLSVAQAEQSQECSHSDKKGKKCGPQNQTQTESNQQRQGRPQSNARGNGLPQVLLADIQGTSHACPLVFLSCSLAVSDARCLSSSDQKQTNGKSQAGEVKLGLSIGGGPQLFSAKVEYVRSVEKRAKETDSEATALLTVKDGCTKLRGQLQTTKLCNARDVQKRFEDRTRQLNQEARFQTYASGGYADLAPVKYKNGHKVKDSDVLAFRSAKPLSYLGGVPLFLSAGTSSNAGRCLAGFNIGVRKPDANDEDPVGKFQKDIIGFNSVTHLETLSRAVKQKSDRSDADESDDVDDEE